MLTTSLGYVWIFLPLVVAARHFFRRFAPSRSIDFLAAACSLFYLLGSHGRGTFLQLLIAVGLNYLAIVRLSQTIEANARKRLFWAAVFANVLYLFCYKVLQAEYAGTGQQSTLQVPLGISYFTIIQIIALVDTYQGLWRPTAFRTYFSFVSFFPQITAGPIVGQYSYLKQFREYGKEDVSGHSSSLALTLLSLGLFKKVVIADTLSAFVSSSSAHLSSIGPAEAWFSGAAYFLQFFLDFSGCSDMAVGAGLLMGLKLPVNFERPYRCTDIARFWQEWHISLTGFITNYVYTPMLQAWGRTSFLRTMCVTVLSMVVCGMWHGVSFTYLLWGAYHGFGLALYHTWRASAFRPLPAFWAWLLTQLFIFGSYTFVRAGRFSEIELIAAGLLGLIPKPAPFFHQSGLDKLDWALGGAAWLGALYLAFFLPSTRVLMKEFRPSRKWLAVSAIMMIVSCLYMNSSRESNFIYANF